MRIIELIKAIKKFDPNISPITLNSKEQVEDKEVKTSEDVEITESIESKDQIDPRELLTFLLDQSKIALAKYDRQKYLPEFFEYKRFNSIFDGQEFEVTYVKAIKPLNLSKTDREEISRCAHNARQFSIIASILRMVDLSKDSSSPYLGITPEILNRFLDIISPYLTNEIFPSSKKTDSNFDVFVNEIVEELSAIIPLEKKDILSQIRMAERYFVAEYKKNQLLVNETIIDGKSFIQVDEYFTKLTDSQKEKFIQVHHDNQPLWFSYLHSWEQEWLLSVIPEKLEGDWSYFESLSQSSAMSHIPGIQNARMNHLVILNGEEAEILSNSFRTGTMVPYELHEDEESLFAHTEDNAKQVTEHLASIAIEHFTNLWSGINLGDTKPLVLIQSLLSDVILANEDSELTKKQKLAVRKIAIQNSIPGAKIVAGNDPLNLLRYMTTFNGSLSTSRWKHNDEILDYAEDFIQTLEAQRASLSDEQTNQLALIKMAYEALNKLKSDKFGNKNKIQRNFIAYKVAYTAILVKALGGMFSFNCKSGKDRTGLAELYLNAMFVYFSKYKRLPLFDDTKDDRENFLNIIVALFLCLKGPESAANNTPGSLGLKLDLSMFCSDIKKALEENDLYALFVRLAELNKPKEFVKDERRQGRKRSESVKNSPTTPRITKADTSEKDFTSDMKLKIERLRQSTVIPATLLEKELINLANNIPENNEDASIQRWNCNYNELDKAIKTIGKFKKEFRKLKRDVDAFIHKHETQEASLLFLSKSLADDSLFLKTNSDITTIIKQVMFETLPNMRSMFAKATKVVLMPNKPTKSIDLADADSIEAPSNKKSSSSKSGWGFFKKKRGNSEASSSKPIEEVASKPPKEKKPSSLKTQKGEASSSKSTEKKKLPPSIEQSKTTEEVTLKTVGNVQTKINIFQKPITPKVYKQPSASTTPSN